MGWSQAFVCCLWIILAAIPSPAQGASASSPAAEAFLDAVRHHDAAAARSMLVAGTANANTADPLGATALHIACWDGDLPMAALLLEYGADPNARHREGGSTPLHYAVITGRKEIAGLLLDHHADFGARYRGGQSALHLAANRGDLDIVELLVRRGADIHATDDAGSTPLDEAVWKGSAEVTRFLLENGAARASGATPARTSNGPLPSAASSGVPSPSLLFTAAARGNAEVAEVLLDAGADPNSADASGATPLDEAIRFRHTGVVRALLDGGARLEEPARPGKRIHDAVMRGDASLVELLIEHGANLRAVGEAGSTPLHDAALNGNLAVIDVLLKHGDPIDTRNAAGATPLHDASLAGKLDVVKLLLARGADINARDNESRSTPLHYAASWGRADVVAFLLEQHADPSLRNKEGETPLDAATKADQKETANLLRRAYRPRQP